MQSSMCIDHKTVKVFFLKMIVAFFCLLTIVNAEDFYELLGVQQSASTKEIRQAFKKLAITMHPDKNQDDPEAHDNFLKINRAYEVLKDEDLRKKYDLHGEEGLKDDFHGGNRYESWKFYQEEFGIYDDDKEIITLSRSDFEQSVEGTDDVWFINYYSPHCGHCHDLAPTWREVAQELEGVIRIGAVNCEDDWQLCRMQGIRSYPTLVMYPSGEKYMGDRSRRQLLKFALKMVQADVHEIQTEGQIEDNGLPWLITFCGDSGDCLSSTTRIKLAAILADLVNVGTVNCRYREQLCETLGVEVGTYFYTAGSVEKGEGKKVSSLNAQEIAHTVLSWLPDVDQLDARDMQKIIDNLLTGQNNPWLVHFVEGDGSEDIELRKLPAMLEGIQIGRVNCQKLRSKCNQLHIKKFPTFVVYKESGGFELYYGRPTAHDVSAFARDSMNTRLESLTPSDFDSQRVGPSSQKMWFIDFFAPWCPPCMRLLPEFRKAARSYSDNNVGFGTVDCTVHNRLCQQYNIRSYPTTILYNNTVPHQYNGQHSASHIVEFITDTLNPPVMIMNEAMFEERVLGKKDEEIWLIDWFANWCGPCQQLAPEWRRLAKLMRDNKKVQVAQVDCANPSNQWFCQNNGINSYPTIRLYPPGPGSGSYFAYSGWNRDSHSLRAWAYEFLPSKVKTIRYADFYNKVLHSTEPWIIDFYAPWCGHCQVFKPEFDRIAETIDGVAKAGKVNCDEERGLCQQAGIRAYPTVRFYKGARSAGQSQGPYGLEMDNLDAQYIINYIQSRVQKKQHDEL